MTMSVPEFLKMMDERITADPSYIYNALNGKHPDEPDDCDYEALGDMIEKSGGLINPGLIRGKRTVIVG